MDNWKDYYFKTKGSKRHAFSRWLFDKATFFFLKSKPKFIAPNKILLICNGHFGDTIMSTSIFREIKKAYKESELTVLISNISKPIVEKNPYIDKIISMNAFWQKEHRNIVSIKEYIKLIRQLRKEKYDIGIAIQSNIPNILTMYLVGIKKRSAYYNLAGGKQFLTNSVLYENDLHASIKSLELVNHALNMEATNNFPEIVISPEDIAYTNIFFDIYSTINKYICIVPGACAKLQTWDKEKYKAIIDWMIQEHPEHHIILAGGKEDEELIDYLSLDSDNNLKPKCIKLINHNLRYLGMIFNHAQAVLLQDGGCMHLAYTMMKDANRKLFILWGPNPLEHVAPLRGNIIHHKLDCYPCRRQESLCKKPEGERCMDLISITEVKHAIQKALQ